MNDYDKMTVEQLLRAVDRSNPEVRALAERLEEHYEPALDVPDILRKRGLI